MTQETEQELAAELGAEPDDENWQKLLEVVRSFKAKVALYTQEQIDDYLAKLAPSERVKLDKIVDLMGIPLNWLVVARLAHAEKVRESI